MRRSLLLGSLSFALGGWALGLGGFLVKAVPERRRAASPAWLEEAAAAEARGNCCAAQSLYARAIQKDPDSAEAWAALGEHLRFFTQDRAAAAAAFRKALAARGQDANAAAFAWRGLGELAAKDHRDEAASGCFKKSLEALPLADTHRSLCHLYSGQRKFAEAAEEARQAVQLNPDDSIARLLYATQLERKGAQEEGRKQFELALSLSGIDAQGEGAETVHCCVLYNAAGYLSVRGDQPGALRMLEKFFKTPNHLHLSREEIESDPDFENIRDVPEFRELLETQAP